MDTEPLQHLTPQSANVGVWLLKVSGDPRVEQYKWQKASASGTAKKLVCVLVSDDASQYCEGVYKKVGSEPEATQKFNYAITRFQKGTVWKVSKVGFVKQNLKYLGCSCKVVIDMNASKFEPVINCPVTMPAGVEPPDDLATLLQCPDSQTVDIVALVTKVGEPQSRMTKEGPRDMVEISIMDDSGEKCGASAEFTAWFPPQAAGSVCPQQELLKQAMRAGQPVAFLNLVVQKAAGAKTSLKTCREKFSFFPCEHGPRAERLKQGAPTLTSASSSDLTIVSELSSDYAPIDYSNAPSTFTVCHLLHHVIQAGSSAMSSQTSGTSVFQVNHARILEPKSTDKLFVNSGDRLFPTVQVYDCSGSVTLKMVEKVALDLSGCAHKEEFKELASQGAVNFPILCSIRVAVKKSSGSDGSDLISAIIVEASQQEFTRRTLPYASMDDLQSLMQCLPFECNKMLVSPMASIRQAHHAGMVVDTGNDTIQASYVLTLIAHIGKSQVKELAGGQKLISNGGWNIPFIKGFTPSDGAPEHADHKLDGALASYCTSVDVQDYTLTGRDPKKPVYALILVSAIQKVSGVSTFMVDKVSTQVGDDNVDAILQVLRRLSQISFTKFGSTNANKTPTWTPDQTPYTARKTRKLCEAPTDASMPDP